MTLRVRDVRFGGGTLAFDAAPGSVVALVGDPEARATALDLVSGLRPAGEGTVALDGVELDPASVGIAREDHALLGALTAAENVALRLLARGCAADPAEIDRLLAAVLLPPAVRGNLVEQLSGGQQQRVAVARALAGAPALICLGDPTSELDGTTGDAVLAALRQAADAGAIVVLTAPAAPPGADLVVPLDAGRPR